MPQTGTKTKDRIGTYIEQFFRRKDIYFVCHTQLQACFVLPSYVLVFGHQIIIMLPFSNSSAITALLRLKLNHCKTNANDTYTIIYPYSCSTFPFHSFHRASVANLPRSAIQAFTEVWNRRSSALFCDWAEVYAF